MHLLRTSLQATSRRQLLRRNKQFDFLSCANKSADNGPFRSVADARRRRDESESDGSFQALQDNSMRDLERYTQQMVKSRGGKLLGTMAPYEWEEMCSAVEAWLYRGGGYGMISAEQLIKRLDVELAILNPQMVRYQTQIRHLQNIHRALPRSWLQVFQNHTRSKLALERSESALDGLLEFPSDAQQAPPIHEIVVTLEGWLQFDTMETTNRAASLLLRWSSDSASDHFADLGPALSPYFGKTLTQFVLGIQNTDEDEMSGAAGLELELMDRMEILSGLPEWSDLEIPEAYRKVVLEASLDEAEAPSPDDVEAKKMSSFEIEALQKRIIDFVNIAESDDKIAIEKHLSKLQNTKPKEELVQSLVQFYIRVGDPNKTAYWVQMLAPEKILSLLFDGNLYEKWMVAWLNSNDKRAPWKADEAFRRVLNQLPRDTEQSGINVEHFNLLSKIWVNSEDPSAGRKIFELASLMKQNGVHENNESLLILVKACALERKADTTKNLLKRVFAGWGGFDDQEKPAFAEAVLAVAAEMNVPSVAFKIVNRLMADKLELSDTGYQYSLQLISSEDMGQERLIRMFDILKGAESSADVSLYWQTMVSLLRHEKVDWENVSYVFNEWLDFICKHKDIVDPESTGEFFSGVIKMLTERQLYSQARDYLSRAENALLVEAQSSDKVSLIPLDCYRRLISRKWYTSTSVPHVEDCFDRLLRLHKSGYANLAPDGEILVAMMKVKAVAKKDASEVERLLDDLLDSMTEATDELNLDACNAVLYGCRYHPSPKKMSKKSTALLNRMISLGTTPDTKTLDCVMYNVNRSGENVYPTVGGMFQYFKTYDIEPGVFSYEQMLDACAASLPHDYIASFKTCLKTLETIRRRKMVNASTYDRVTTVLVKQVPSEKLWLKARIAAATMHACCEDGSFSPEVRERLQQMVSKKRWRQLYNANLEDDGTEPLSWSRKVKKIGQKMEKKGKRESRQR